MREILQFIGTRDDHLSGGGHVGRREDVLGSDCGASTGKFCCGLGLQQQSYHANKHSTQF